MEIEQQQQMLRERIRELMEQLEKEWDVRKVLEVRKLFAIQRKLEREMLFASRNAC